LLRLRLHSAELMPKPGGSSAMTLQVSYIVWRSENIWSRYGHSEERSNEAIL